MEAILIPSVEEFNTLRKQLNELDKKSSEVEFRIFVAKNVYDQLLNQIGNPEKHSSTVKIKNTEGGDIRVVTEDGKIIVQRKHRIKNIDFTVSERLDGLQLRLSFSVEEQLLEREDELSKRSNSYFDTIRYRERSYYFADPFLYSFTKVTSISEEEAQYEVEAEFKGDLNNIFSLLKLNKIFTQLLSGNNVIFTASLLRFFNKPTNIYRKHIQYLKESYFVTEKLDGERSFLCGTPYGTYLTIDPSFFDPDIQFESLTILDGEYLKDVRRFYAFDCLCYNGANIMNRDGVNNRLGEVAEKGFIFKKIHRSLLPPNEEIILWMRETIKRSEDEKSNVDGLIFTSRRGNYFNTKTLKWKPANKTTIDFLYIPDESNNYYKLYVTMNEGPTIKGKSFPIKGAKKEDIGKILLVKKTGWNQLEKVSEERGIPCTESQLYKCTEFQLRWQQPPKNCELCLIRYDGTGARFSLERPKDYHEERFGDPNISQKLFTVPITDENKELSRKIVETKFLNNRFVPVRIRLDKEKPNKYSVAMDNWEDITFPIDHRELIMRAFSPEMYNYKKIMRTLKYDIFKFIPEKSVVLDIGTGFGGDLNRYESIKVSKVIAVEPSRENYNELMRRYETGKAVRTYSFEMEGFNEPMENYDEKEPYNVVVAMLSMNFFFKAGTNSLNNLFSLIAPSNLFIGAFMDSKHLQRLMNNGNNKYYYVRPVESPSKIEKGGSVNIRIGDTIVEEQTEYAMNSSEFISEWKKFVAKNKIAGFNIYQIKFSDKTLPDILLDLYNSYVCVILSRNVIDDLTEFKEYPENQNMKKLFIYKAVDVPKYDHQTDEMLENKRRLYFKLDWYDEKRDRVFRHGTLGYNDCFFHSVLTDIDGKYRSSDEDSQIKKAVEVRTKDLKKYLTFEVWRNTHVYVQLLECVKERLKEDEREGKYSEGQILDELYKAYLERITHSCDIIESEDEIQIEEHGIQVDEYMIEILSNFFNRNIYFITTRSHSTKRIPYIPSNPNVQYKEGRKSIVIAFSQFGNSGHYEGIGILREKSSSGKKEEIYDFEPNDPFILTINKYIQYVKSNILTIPLFAMKEYEIKRSFDEPRPPPQENKEILMIKDELDVAKEQYIRIDKKELQILDIYSELKMTIFNKYGSDHPITNSWMKLWEMIISMDLLPNKSNTVFCNAEMPGNFVYALICYSNTREKELIWYASSLYPEGAGTLTDRYKMLERFPERWIMSKEHKGNVLVKEDVNYIEKKIESLTNRKGVDLYTSDIGTEKKDEEEYIHEERDYLPLHMGQILCGLITLKNGGNMVIKQFGFTMPETIVLIGKLANMFDTCVVFKPTTSKPCNSESYLICKGYHKEVAGELIRELRENKLLDTSLSIIQYESIVDASMKLMERQKTIINGTFPALIPNTPEYVSFSIFKEKLKNMWLRVFLENVDDFGKVH
jgi:hypothetical protein